MISVVPKFRKQKSPAQSARHQKHKNMLKFRQRSTSVTVHYIFCNVPAASSLGQKKPLRQRRLSPLLPPTALLGEDTHRHCTSIFLICCLTFPSDYSSFITYRSTKVKPFCKKEQVLRFFVDFCAKTRANGFSADTFLLLHRQYTPPLFFIHIFARILHKLCIQYTYTQLLSELSKHFFAERQQILYSFCRFSLRFLSILSLVFLFLSVLALQFAKIE